MQSGLRIGGTLLLGIFFLAGLTISVRFLTLQDNVETEGAHPVLGAVALLLLSTILFCTTRIWTKWLLAIMGYCAFRLLFGLPALLIFGRMRRADLDTVLLMIPAILASALFTHRFWTRLPKGAERIGLVVFVVSVVFAMVLQSWIPWVVGTVILAAGEGIRFLMHRPMNQHKPLHRSD